MVPFNGSVVPVESFSSAVTTGVKGVAAAGANLKVSVFVAVFPLWSVAVNFAVHVPAVSEDVSEKLFPGVGFTFAGFVEMVAVLTGVPEVVVPE